MKKLFTYVKKLKSNKLKKYEKKYCIFSKKCIY